MKWILSFLRSPDPVRVLTCDPSLLYLCITETTQCSSCLLFPDQNWDRRVSSEWAQCETDNGWRTGGECRGVAIIRSHTDNHFLSEISETMPKEKLSHHFSMLAGPSPSICLENQIFTKKHSIMMANTDNCSLLWTLFYLCIPRRGNASNWFFFGELQIILWSHLIGIRCVRVHEGQHNAIYY